MGNIALRATWIMPINNVGSLYALAFTRDGFTISCTTIAYARDEILVEQMPLKSSISSK